MNTRKLTTLILAATTVSLAASLHAAAKTPAPFKALLITGGCCHDYDNQKTIIPDGIDARTKLDIEWTIIHEGGKTTNTKIPFHQNPDWAEGYDVVIHNECFAAINDEAFVESILKPHKEGTPAVLIHCAMHSYRTKANDHWFEFCGMQSNRHGPHHAFMVEIVDHEHEITKGLVNWTTPKGELYFISKVFPTTTPLAQGKSNQTGEMHPNIWVNAYGPNKTRVFGTTIGHHNETMEDPSYLMMVTRGLLWAAGKPVDELVKGE